MWVRDARNCLVAKNIACESGTTGLSIQLMTARGPSESQQLAIAGEYIGEGICDDQEGTIGSQAEPQGGGSSAAVLDFGNGV